MAAEHPLLSADEMASKLGISGRCIHYWYQDGVIPAAVHQGKVIRFREADVMSALAEARRQRDMPLAQESVVRLALWLVAPDVAEQPPWLLTRDPTEQEEQDATRLAIFHYENLKGISVHEQRRAYVQGVHFAAEMLRNPPPPTPAPA